MQVLNKFLEGSTCHRLDIIIFQQIFQNLQISFFEDGVDDVGGDFGEGLHDENSLVHEGVGDLEVRLIDDLLVEKQQIEIDGSGCPFLSAGASELFFDFEEEAEQFFGAVAAAELGGGVEVIILLGGASDGRGFDKAGMADDGDEGAVFEQGQGTADVASAGAEVAAQGDICGFFGG